MSSTRLSLLLLTLLLIGWLAYRCAPTRIEHEGYRFELPMDFEEAVTQFGLDSLSVRLAVRFDERGWLTVKAIQDYSRRQDKLLGLNFYYDDTVDIKAVMQRIEQQFGKKLQSGVGVFPDMNQEWWYLQLTNNIMILVYRNTSSYPGRYLFKEEESSRGNGQDRQWVVAFTEKLKDRYSYINCDGVVGPD